MTPVIRRLQSAFFDHSLGMDAFNVSNYSFSERIKTLSPAIYRKIIPSHLVLHLEYSLLGQQIRSNLLSDQPVKKEQIEEQIRSALLLAELLEHIYAYYLIVPREVRRLRVQKKIYRDLLIHLLGTSPKDLVDNEEIAPSVSFSQNLRDETIRFNFYRLLFIRSKRVFDLVDSLNLGNDWYHYFIRTLDNYTGPLVRYQAWVFFLPRLSVNLFLLMKHIIPGSWMGVQEKSLDGEVRFQAQLARRWFELGNDLSMLSVGLMNCFVLTGVLAPIGLYLSIAFFGFDIVLSAGRTYIELNRLTQLYKEYQDMADSMENKEEIQQYLKLINDQIHFEILRVGSHTLITTGIFLAMCCMAPILALSPPILLASAIFLACISLINLAIATVINYYRPQDMIDVPKAGISSLGFFAKQSANNSPKSALEIEQSQGEEEGSPYPCDPCLAL